MLDALQEAARDLLNPTGYEGFALVTRRRLKERGEALNNTIAWFADERQLEAAPLKVELPTLSESIDNARTAVASGIDAAGAKIKLLVRGRERDGQPDESSPAVGEIAQASAPLAE